MANERDLPIGCGVLVVKDGKILCGIRSDNGLCCGPGGHIEDGEAPEKAAVRETAEEFGITPKRLFSIGFLQSDEYRPSAVYVCTEYEGDPKCDSNEMITCGFLGLEELEQLELHPAFKDSVGLLLDVLFDGQNNDELETDGGKGSGNWGHSGRPGQRGGSASGGMSLHESNVNYSVTGGKKQTFNTPIKGDPGVVELKKNFSSDEKALYDKVREDSDKAVKLLDDTYQHNIDTWEAAKKAIENGEDPVTGSAAAKDHTIPGASAEAQRLYNEQRLKEPDISRDMCEIAAENGVIMYGLDFACKTGKSMRSKIERKRADDRKKNKPEKTDEEYIAGMGDIVRYTMLTNHDNIADMSKTAIDNLKGRGYNVIELDNKYQDPDSAYKGIHINAISPSGQKIELQVHSEQTMRVKETIHPMYEVSREDDSPSNVRKVLNQEMKSISEAIPTPKGVMDDSMNSWKGGQ